MNDIIGAVYYVDGSGKIFLNRWTEAHLDYTKTFENGRRLVDILNPEFEPMEIDEISLIGQMLHRDYAGIIDSGAPLKFPFRNIKVEHRGEDITEELIRRRYIEII